MSAHRKISNNNRRDQLPWRQLLRRLQRIALYGAEQVSRFLARLKNVAAEKATGIAKWTIGIAKWTIGIVTIQKNKGVYLEPCLPLSRRVYQ
jgi:hypothetical protein